MRSRHIIEIKAASTSHDQDGHRYRPVPPEQGEQPAAPRHPVICENRFIKAAVPELPNTLTAMITRKNTGQIKVMRTQFMKYTGVR